MRVLIRPPWLASGDDDDAVELPRLATAYELPPGRHNWLSVNMVTTLDGAASGADGRSGSINTAADNIVFELIRAMSDLVLVGAGTARTEGYGPLTLPAPYAALRADLGLSAPLPLALVTESGQLTETLTAPVTPGSVLAVTHAQCPRLTQLREGLGAEQVVIAGDDHVDLALARELLHAKGFHRVHSEGGPALLGALLSAGLVDELDLTIAPVLVGGQHPRIVSAPAMSVVGRPVALVEGNGSLIGRWFIDSWQS